MADAAPAAPAKKSVFERQRERITQQSAAEGQESQDALKRQFARMNNLNSGAYVTQTQKAADDVAKRKESALMDVDAAEATVEEQRAEAEKGRQFQSAEAEKGRGFSREERLGSQQFASGESAMGRAFAAAEADKGRGFMTKEREAGQSFASGEAQKGREFQASERGAAQQFATQERQAGQTFTTQERGQSQEYAATEAAKARAQQQGQFDATLQQNASQFDKQFTLDEEVSRFNMDMANKIFEKKDFFEKIMDPLGGKKTGIGGKGNTMDPIGITGGLLG